MIESQKLLKKPFLNCSYKRYFIKGPRDRNPLIPSLSFLELEKIQLFTPLPL